MRFLTITFVSIVLMGAGCDTDSPDSCKVVCSVDADCPSGQSCGELGLCTAGEACACTTGTFLGCAGETARFCNDAADGVRDDPCAFGCNAEASSCNVCAPATDSCSLDGAALERCAADGQSAQSEVCTLGCMPSGAAAAAHCGYLEPLYFPDICDTQATGAELVYDDPITLDTGADTTCTEIVTQPGGLAVCVIRAPKITFASTVKVNGTRLIAFVADEAIVVQGTLDASADLQIPGPGGTTVSGSRVVGAAGGGGAGFRLMGAPGGSASVNGGGGSGGAIVDATTSPIMLGGAHSQYATAQQPGPAGGGGGGGVALIACRGDVSVSGTVDVNGGGGRGGYDVDTNSANGISLVGAAGGGSGGYLVLQGVRVTVGSVAGIYANGGGGGGGCSSDQCVGDPGQDGQRSTAAATGGALKGEGGTGGTGGTANLPTFGLASYYSAGGGGGSSGYLQACIPSNGQATLLGMKSPAFSETKTIQVR